MSALNRKRPLEDKEQPLVEPKQKARRRWKMAEEDVLRDHFKLTMTTPLPSCGANTDPGLFDLRSKKDIQDKCRTILRTARDKTSNT